MRSWVPSFGVLLRAAVALAIAGAIGGFVVVWAGLYSVAATRGHWPGFEVFLKFAMRSSVRTHALLIDPPPLGEPDRLRRGAGHFQQGCAPCHGSPAGPPMLVVRYMLPPPTDLMELVPTWKDRELFWIVKNGLKYTGMPGWPAQQREDEVWDVVSFLRVLPGMTPDRYRDLAGFASGEEPSRTPDQARLAACAHCHGEDGAGRSTTAFPRLDLQTGPYLLEQLQAFKADRRPSGYMQTATADLTPREMAWLAEHYGMRRAGPVVPSEATSGQLQGRSDALRRQGEALFRNGAPEQGVPPCAACHGPTRDVRYPALLGQYAGHTRTQLELYKQGKRVGTEAARLMATIAGRLSVEQVEALATYLAAEPAR